MAAPTASHPETVNSPAHFHVYAAVADIDLVAEGKGNCRAIRVVGAGVLQVKRASDGTTIPVPFKSGEIQLLQCTAIIASGSTVTGAITVSW
jgi:hypothetical protein